MRDRGSNLSKRLLSVCVCLRRALSKMTPNRPSQPPAQFLGVRRTKILLSTIRYPHRGLMYATLVKPSLSTVVGVLYALSLFAITQLTAIPSGVVEEGVKASRANKVALLVPGLNASTWSYVRDCHLRMVGFLPLSEREVFSFHLHHRPPRTTGTCQWRYPCRRGGE